VGDIPFLITLTPTLSLQGRGHFQLFTKPSTITIIIKELLAINLLFIYHN